MPQSEPFSSSSSTRFTFSSTAADIALADVNSRYEILQARIDRLVNEATVNGVPVISSLLSYASAQEGGVNPAELNVLGKALIRLSDLYQQYEKLGRQKEVIEYARKNPDFMAWAFGDFASDVDKLLESEIGTDK